MLSSMVLDVICAATCCPTMFFDTFRWLCGAKKEIELMYCDPARVHWPVAVYAHRLDYKPVNHGAPSSSAVPTAVRWHWPSQGLCAGMSFRVRALDWQPRVSPACTVAHPPLTPYFCGLRPAILFGLVSSTTSSATSSASVVFSWFIFLATRDNAYRV